jgi:hypothetical protein
MPTLIKITPENPAGMGWTYDPETGAFIAPPVEEVDEVINN